MPIISKVSLKASFTVGNEASLTLKALEGSYEITVKGPLVTHASNRPVTKEAVSEKLLMFGETPFEVIESEINVGNDIFIPLSRLKEMRRNAAFELEKCILSGFGGK